MTTSPVLLLLYDRPDYTQRLVECLRRVRPKNIYISIDGAKDNDADRQAVSEVYKLVQTIDWTKNVKTLTHENNKGCRLSVSSAISWFFEQVDEGIVLEDDCLPHPDFFRFIPPYLINIATKIR